MKVAIIGTGNVDRQSAARWRAATMSFAARDQTRSSGRRGERRAAAASPAAAACAADVAIPAAGAPWTT